MLRDEEREALLALEPPLVSCAARYDLIRPGERVEYSCLVQSGFIARSERFADGTRQSTAIYLPGDMADLHSIAVPEASWALSALSDCSVYEVPHGDILKIAATSPNVCMALWRDTIVDASILSKWVSLNSRPTSQRIAHLICELGLRFEIAGLGKRTHFTLSITQEQYAELAGVTPNHVYRVMRELRQRGLINLSRGQICVANYRGLERLAEFDDAYLLRPQRPSSLQL